MAAKTRIILPQKYYLDYFNYLVDFVEKNYKHILDFPEYDFFQSFRSLSEPAQCLYLRFSNRQGDFFRLSKVSYEEIPDLHAAKEELYHHGFLQINASSDPYQFRLFTKSELIHLFDFLDIKQRKPEILHELTEMDVPVIHEIEEILQVLKNDEVAFIKLLFFGDRKGHMTEFVIRDVGNVRIEKLDASQFKPWFESRDEALSVMHIGQFKKAMRELMLEDHPLEESLKEIPWRVWLSFPRSCKAATELLLEIAHHLEQRTQHEEALELYQLTNKAPANERKIRLCDKLDRKEDALELAQMILINPSNASELTFARDYLDRKGIRIDRSMTKRLKASPSITLTNANMKVEHLVLDHFYQKGWEGVHAENFLWRGLFGLTFWEIIFNPQYGSFHHPLQRQPSDLSDASFFETRSLYMQEHLTQLSTRKKLLKYMTKNYEAKYGTANRFVTWHESLLPILEKMVVRLPLKGIKQVLLEISKNTKDNSTGFPDLFIWKENDYHFYEVKSPNDHLSAQQLFWLNFLSKAKIKVDVIRVNYAK